MKQHEIIIGQKYIAKVNNKLVPVRVDEIREVEMWVGMASSGKKATKLRYLVTNLETGRKTIFRSSRKFLCCSY